MKLPKALYLNVRDSQGDDLDDDEYTWSADQIHPDDPMYVLVDRSSVKEVLDLVDEKNQGLTKSEAQQLASYRAEMKRDGLGK